MSTIALPFEKGIRHFMLFDAVDAATTSKGFISTGSNGNVVVLGEKGGPWAAGEDLAFLKKNPTGRLAKSDLITPKDITYMKGTAPRAKVGKIQTIKVESGFVVGNDYFVDFKINYGTSEENFISFIASTRVLAGDTATKIATRIGVELATQFDRSIHVGYQGGKGTEVMITGTSVPTNKYFKFTQVAGVLTVQEKDFILTDYVVGLRAFDQLMWNLVTKTASDSYGTASTALTSATTPGVYAKGQGYQMKELEHYLGSHLGEYSTADITLSFNKEYESSISKSYFTIDISYSDVSFNDPHRSPKMLMLVSESLAEINKIGNAIAAAGGPAYTEFVPEV
jgi:hypothetical protein